MSFTERVTKLRDSLALTEQDRQNRQRVIENLDTAERGILILVRKVQQSIWIQGGINVTVLSVERDRVKLGITAPDDVKIMRQELLGAEGELVPETPDSIRERHEGQNPQKK